MATPEWADARLATLKAFQADCKGFCFFVKGSHIPMADQAGRPHFGPKFHKRHHGKPGCGPRHHKGPRFEGKPGFDRPFPPAPQDEALEPPVSRTVEER